MADDSAARYEAGLPAEERRALGQFYTPPWLAEAAVGWALSAGDGPPRVLDPAAGGGAFLLAAHDRLAALHPGTDPLDRIVAVEIEERPLRLAARALAERAGADPSAAETHAASFFDLEPDDLGGFDAVVGNPPYIRAGELSPDAAHFREHLAAFGPPDAAPYLSGGRRLSERSDAYVYFVTHATRFLREGGRLGVVLPTKWLASDYGADFRRFLADRYAVRGVVGFEARAFEDALVEVALVLAERRDDPPKDAPVRFVRLGEEPDAGTVADAVGVDYDVSGGPVIARRGRSRTVALRGSALADDDKPARYLTAPRELLDLSTGDGFAPLSALAEVSRGVMTGANRFFLVGPDDREAWGIEGRFLAPAVRSVREVGRPVLAEGDVTIGVVDVHRYVERVAAEGGDGPLEGRVKRALDRDGHRGLLAYVRHAESEGWHDGRTCRGRRVWFDLGDLPAPDLFVPKLVRERVPTIRNDAGAVPSNAIDCLSARDGVDAGALFGVLNSSICKGLVEVWGRDEAGMLQLMTYETAALPVPDVRAFSPAERAAIREAAGALAAEGSGDDGDGVEDGEGDERGDGENDARKDSEDDARGGGGTQEALDAAVVDALDLDLSAARVRRARERALRRRVGRGG